MKKLTRFNTREVIDAINGLIGFASDLRSGDGIIQVSQGKGIKINVDMLRARIAKTQPSGSGIEWAYCAEAAGTGSSILCYIGISAYDASFVYSKDTIVIYSNEFYKSLQNENLGHTPTEGEWWTVTTTGTESVYFDLLGGISNVSDGHLSLVKGSPILVKMRGDYWRCVTPIEGTEEKDCG